MAYIHILIFCPSLHRVKGSSNRERNMNEFFQVFKHILLTIRSLNTFVNAGWYISLGSDALGFLHALNGYDSSGNFYSEFAVTSHLSPIHQSVVHPQKLRMWCYRISAIAFVPIGTNVTWLYLFQQKSTSIFLPDGKHSMTYLFL